MTPADLTLVRALIRDVRAHFDGRGISGPMALQLADACEILIDDAEFWKELGRALRYPRFCDDQKNFPGSTDAEIKNLRDMLAQLPQHGSGRAARIALDALPALLDEVERLRADAARYRWMRDRKACPFAETDPAWDDLDAAIDAQMRGESEA